MIEKDPIGGDARRDRRARRVPSDAACAYCGLQDPEALIEGKASLLEQHHVIGRVNGPDITLWFCRNHHAIVHERLREAGLDLRAEPSNVLERVIAALRALGVFFVGLGERMLGWAEQTAALVRELDARHPGWREIASAEA